MIRTAFDGIAGSWFPKVKRLARLENAMIITKAVTAPKMTIEIMLAPSILKKSFILNLSYKQYKYKFIY
jgi:hypothetical protein